MMVSNARTFPFCVMYTVCIKIRRAKSNFCATVYRMGFLCGHYNGFLMRKIRMKGIETRTELEMVA